MIDVLAKRVATSKRQILYLFYIILRYIRIKENPKSQGNVGKVLYLISGRAPHSNFEGKKIIEAVYKVMKIVNNDPDMKPYMKIVFIPNFNVYICEQLVAAADLSQHISTPGAEVIKHLSNISNVALRNIKHEVHNEWWITSWKQRWGKFGNREGGWVTEHFHVWI
jgi:hypothetical protein